MFVFAARSGSCSHILMRARAAQWITTEKSCVEKYDETERSSVMSSSFLEGVRSFGNRPDSFMALPSFPEEPVRRMFPAMTSLPSHHVPKINDLLSFWDG